MATTEELIEVLGRAKILSGVRGWGEETVNEIIKRLKEEKPKKLEVSEEFVVKWLPQLSHYIVFNDKKNAVRSLITMLKEAGVRVA